MDENQFADLAKEVFGECEEHEPTCMCCIATVLAKQLDGMANGDGFDVLELLEALDIRIADHNC